MTCVHTVLTNYNLAVIPGGADKGRVLPVAEVVLLGESPRYAIDPNDPTKVTRGAVLTEFRFTGSAGELRSLADQLEAVADRVDELGEAFAKVTGVKPEPTADDAPKGDK
jgi:proteasome assembly chaperone (PAC2) family protein